MKELEAELIEKNAVETMLEHGVRFHVDTNGIFRILVKRIPFRINQPYLGTLLHISRIFLEISLDEKKLGENAYQESYMLVPENAKRAAKLISLAVLNSKWKIRLFSGLLTNYFIWRITPSKLFQIMLLVLTISNTASFTNSIRLIQSLRMMKPKEEKNLSLENQGG